MILEFVCNEDNIRLSEELKTHVSRHLYKHIKSTNSKILVNGVEKKTFEIINKGDKITIDYNREKEIEWEIYESNLDVLYEDEHYLVVYKKPDLLTIPTKSNPKSLYQELLYYFDKNGLPKTISILNRLDKETQGLVLVAKDAYSASLLQPTHEHIERRYYALCHGILKNKEAHIELNIKKSDDSNKRIVVDDGILAISNYKVIKELDNKSIVEFILETGRTHQIRVTSSYLGNPLCGDKLYGIDDGYNDLCLLSYYLKFTNPYTKKEVLIKTNKSILDLK